MTRLNKNPPCRWAQLDSAARYFLPREEDKAKVSKELGLQLSQALSKEELDSPASRKAACIKASTAFFKPKSFWL